MSQQKHHKYLQSSNESNMSAKCALIFALAALCCLLLATEAASPRRVAVARNTIVQADEDDSKLPASVDEEGVVDHQQELDSLAHAAAQFNAGRQSSGVYSEDDARARRVVRRSRRRGGRRGGARRGGRGGRGGRGRRSGPRRRNSFRRRNGARRG
ncbi:protein nemuri [Drosophila busckii]|uniref:protein nemuri n=1 Tax=Drosophila busckii TaxID=30019 RepID=UPI00083EF42A|nr:protein nemuri [Drosophila busckii]